MTHRKNISTYISRIAISLLLIVAATGNGRAQQKNIIIPEDSIPMFRGFAVSFDLVGPAMLALSDHGEYEGAFRLNLHDQWFPIVEVGYGKANHENDEVTGITYKTGAPYFRIGMDWNLLKKKHGPNRLYGGFRYAFTSYKVDIMRGEMDDPVWQGSNIVDIQDMQCSQHWLEAVFGIDAKISGPIHLGWNVRYKRRIAHNDGTAGQTWYIPGFGTYGGTRIAANFNVIIDI